ncbi:MAG: porin family protein [Bacteroides sp.]
MKKEKDEITYLFRSRLGDAEMPVRDGFWEELNCGLDTCHHRRLVFFRLTAAASVLLVLAASSAAFWYFSPKKELEEAFTQIAVANKGRMDGDGVKQISKPLTVQPILQQPVSRKMVGYRAESENREDSASITVSLSFRLSMTSIVRRAAERKPYPDYSFWRTANAGGQGGASAEQKTTETVVNPAIKASRWALKAAVGTSLPAAKGKYKMPVTAALTVERQLNQYLAVETGLQYANLRAEGQGLHYLGIPLKVNVTLARSSAFDLYAVVGGLADKCIAGAPNNSFQCEPITLAVMGGLGVNYKINNRIALFAEPSVSHHFHTDSRLKTVRTERPTTMNLICGLRMTY